MTFVFTPRFILKTVNNSGLLTYNVIDTADPDQRTVAIWYNVRTAIHFITKLEELYLDCERRDLKEMT